jgi:hypothetical protein
MLLTLAKEQRFFPVISLKIPAKPAHSGRTSKSLAFAEGHNLEGLA